MYNTLLNLVLPKTPWGYMNKNNHFNFIIISYNLVPDDKKKDYINNIKMIIGLSFVNDLKHYLFEKYENHEMLKLL
jgi:hypothetical protein